MNYARQLWETIRSLILGTTNLSTMQRWFEGNTTGATSVTVTEDSAQTLSAVWNAVTLIAGTLGSLPLQLYRRTADGDREVMADHWLYPIVHDRPNPDMSAMDFRQTMQAHVLNWGNAFAEITRNGAGRVASLYPIHPARVTLKRDGGGLYYEVTNPEDYTVIRLVAADMLHIKGYSPDGLWGYSVIAKARESLGYTIRSEQFGSAFFGNATIHGGIVKHPGRLSETAHARLLHDLEARHKGMANAFKLAVLEEGMTWERMGIPPADAQFLEGRTFQILEVCRWYNIQPHKLKEMTHATFCLPAGEMVLTEDGPRAIETIRPGDQVWSRGDDGLILAPVIAGGCTGTDPILTIRTENRTLRCNARHPVLCRRRTVAIRPGAIIGGAWIDGAPHAVAWTTEYVSAGALREGDTLVTLDRLPDAGSLEACPTRLPTIGFMEFCGLLMGDGNLITGRRGAYVTLARASHAAYMEYYRAVIRAEFHDAFGRGVRLQESARQTRFSSTHAVRELTALGLAGRASTKQVPGWIFRLPESHRLAFLRGFLDADGSCDKKGRLCYGSSNLILLGQIRDLAMGCGIPVTNLLSRHGQTRLPNGMMKAYSFHVFTCSDPGANRRIGSRTPIYIARMEAGQPFGRKGRAYPRFGGPGFSESGLSLARIVSIQEGPPEPVYDLTVRGTHSFIASGVIVHNTNIEHQAQEFVQDTLMPWLVKWEQEMNYKLISPLERKIQYVQHNVDGLLRGDTESRYRAYATARNWGWLNANTICRKENLPRLPDDQGEVYMVPANMVPAEKFGEDPAPPPPAALPPPPDPDDEDIEEEDGEPAEEAAAGRAVPAESNGYPDRTRRAQLIAAQRALIGDVVRRNLAREKDKARTAATHGRSERLRAWIGDFYPRHTEIFRAQLLPVVQMHLALTASDADPDALTRQYAEAHVTESKRQLYTLLEQKIDDLHAAVEELMARWDLERINTIPDALLVEEITHGL